MMKFLSSVRAAGADMAGSDQKLHREVILIEGVIQAVEEAVISPVQKFVLT